MQATTNTAIGLKNARELVKKTTSAKATQSSPEVKTVQRRGFKESGLKFFCELGSILDTSAISSD